MTDTETEAKFRDQHGDEVVAISNLLVAMAQSLTGSATVGLNSLLNAMLIVICDQCSGDMEAAKSIKNGIIAKLTDEALETFNEGHQKLMAHIEAQSASRQ